MERSLRFSLIKNIYKIWKEKFYKCTIYSVYYIRIKEKFYLKNLKTSKNLNNVFDVRVSVYDDVLIDYITY